MADLATLVQELSINKKKIDESNFSTEELALKSQWETLTPTANEFLPQLNDSLRSKTYLVGSRPSHADVSVFKVVFPLASLWTEVDDLAKNRHIVRWCDLVQNTLVNVPDSKKLKVDTSIKLPREFKKKSKDSAAKKAKIEDQIKNAPKIKEEKLKMKQTGQDEEQRKKAKEAKEAKKLAKAKAKAELEAKLKAAEVPPNPSQIDFRVGFIEKAVAHPNADSLYVSTIHMGDPDGQPRTVCSGLVKYIPLEEMQQRYVIVIANLKPVTMRGIKSCAMVLCASQDDTVEFVNPPANSKAGDKIFFQNFDGQPEKVLNPKKKIWETVQPHFTTNENFEVVYREDGKEDVKLVNKNNELCKNTTIVSANVR